MLVIFNLTLRHCLKGSIYLLALLASAQGKSAMLKLPMDQIIRLGSLIRCPTPGKDFNI
jgi:hypothetical protein